MAVELCGTTAIYGTLCDLCSLILSKILNPEHGDQAITAAEVLKSLSQAILLLKSQARTFALGFVVNKMVALAKDSGKIKKAVVNLPMYLVHKAPDKSEPRASAVDSIMEIVKALECEDQIGFAEYVVKMTQGKSQLRLLAVDLMPILVMSLRDPLGLNSEIGVENSWGLRCLEALIQRCSDVTAGIRARAMTNLAQLVGFLSGDDRSREVLKEVMKFNNANRNSAGSRMNDLLRKRCADEKAATMGMACSDPLVSIRKAAVSALSEAFRTFSDDSVTKEWLHSVPRLITDNETSIQEECENLFLELVLDRVSRAGNSNLQNRKSVFYSFEREIELLFPEGVLGLLKEICNGEVAPWVKKICTSLGKKKRLKPKLACALQNIIRTSESVWLSHSMPIEKWMAPPGVWLLLSEMKRLWALNPILLLGQETVYASCKQFLMFSVELLPEPAADLAHKLLQRIEEFNMHSTEVNAHVKALRTLCKRKASNPEEADGLVMRWVQQLLSKATQILEMYMSKDSEANKENTFLTPPVSGSKKGKRAAASMSRLLSQAIIAAYTIGSLVIVCPSSDLKAIVPVLHTIITSGSSDPKLNKLLGTAVSIKYTAPSLYIQAWLAMGKVCLADEKLAKRYIPLFVQELEKSDCAALRNNIVVMMADFCIRYTALVDCYISKITKCLRDPCELVRRQTFILLSRLLQRDYVKWRGAFDFLFYVFAAKAPLLAYNSFVEAIFVLNDCDPHNGHSRSQSSRAEGRLFSIRRNDEKSRSKRMHIYVSLLKQMAPEHLLATFAKVCAEILASASDGMLNTEDATEQAVLQDAFQILACKEIRIPFSRGPSSDLGDIDDEGGDSGEGAAAAAVRGRVITQAVKKGLIQNTIPIFIELKRLLESKNNPLTGSLMECLRILLKDYKNEIDEILVADKQLQKELIYDMQRNVRNKVPDKLKSGNSKVASAVADVVATATARSVLREVNRGASTPPLSAMSVPKLKPSNSAILESLRRIPCFESDEDN
ncbi:binding protein [Actinidia rufa]|uniref:Binding protein n=1 Tax=Actinidia rufa TaxID=165716 RepID=A0A7J0GDZ1_9ERIC|nr:binding protein [Actinidia rufa]